MFRKVSSKIEKGASGAYKKEHCAHKNDKVLCLGKLLSGVAREKTWYM